MNIEIWSLGKANDSFIEEGIQYYFGKTKPWNNIELVLLQVPKKKPHYRHCPHKANRRRADFKKATSQSLPHFARRAW